MDKEQAINFIRQTFLQAFDKARFRNFTLNLLNHLDESKATSWNSPYVKDAFKRHIQRYERIGTFTSPQNEKLDVLIVYLTQESKLERARTALRNFVADHLYNRDKKDAALVAFVSPSETTWRFSYVKMEYATVQNDSGKVGVETRLTPARRFSYIVGEGESCHTAQTRFLDLLQNTETDPMLADIEAAFSVEAVTKEFFTKYAELFQEIHAELEILLVESKIIYEQFTAKGVNSVDFAKKLMGQIVFLYFLQRKGWLGVAKGQDWGSGPRNFLRRLANCEYGKYHNFFTDILHPLFYDTLATDRGQEAWCDRFNCRIPFLNGGLFEPLGNYDWRRTDIILPNRLFTNSEFVEEGITGTGVLDVFDRYNFTVNEAEPLEKEVAIDPEMLGKVFENLIEENRRRGLGSYYTPREIVHYMCQESLINYLDTALNLQQQSLVPSEPKQAKLFGETDPEQITLKTTSYEEVVPRIDIETFVHLGEQISHYEAVDTNYRIRMPKTIDQYALLIDNKLANITICDPAVGSGAFPVGMMNEIVRARSALTPYFNDVEERTPYHFKRRAIQKCLYGVDIDPGAVEIAKLRLWLSLVVDEEDTKQIKPLPNLDYKIVAGNSLLGFPFKSQRVGEIEKLKDKLFDETDHEKKAQFKTQVDKLLAESFAASKKSLGYEVNFDFGVVFSEAFREKGGFDVVIGNPPYGADISASDLKTIMLRIQDTTNRNSAALFIDVAKNRITNQLGGVSFIVPKSLLYTEKWNSLAQALASKTSTVVDVEQAFENVLLEQVVFVYNHSMNCTNYLSRKFVDDLFTRSTLIPTKYITHFGAWICDVSSDEIGIAMKMSRSERFLGKISRTTRGLPIQKNLTSRGKHQIIGGKNIIRYGINGVKGYVTEICLTDKRKKVNFLLQPKVMSQRIVAHIANPHPHIKITATVDKVGEILGVDTVENTVICDDIVDPSFVAALFNSMLVNWYAYKFIFCGAIRTMDFDDYYVSKIPLPDVTSAQQSKVTNFVDRILAMKKRDLKEDTTAWEREIDQLVYQLYGLTPEEIAIVEAAS